MNKFITTPLCGVTEQRFRILIGYVGSLEWWNSVFDAGACIAGGAAMFVADQVQCICDVGDIDIWVPKSVDMTPFVESLCKWLEENNLDHRMRIQNHIVTVFNPVMNIQFISAKFEFNIAALLDGFDYDCVQCAIYSHVDHVLRNGKSTTTPHLLVSQFAQDAHQTRQIKWINLRRWKFAKFAEHQSSMCKERIQQRQAKIHRKHFFTNGTDNIIVEPHCCAIEHRVVHADYWNMICTMREKFSDFREQIARIFVPKRNIDYVNNYVENYCESLQQNGQQVDEDNVAEYVAFMLENLKLDEETFKTAKIELSQTENKWVPAPTVTDKKRTALEHKLQQWKSLYAGRADKRFKFAIRNLELLVDHTVPLSAVRDSILSDACKCGQESGDKSVFLFGVSMDFQMHDENSVHGLLQLIERTFL